MASPFTPSSVPSVGLTSQPFSLTAAQVKAATLTPATVIAAPGAGKLLVPLLYVFSYTFVSVPFTGGGVFVSYGTAADLGIVITSLLDASQSLVGWTAGVDELWARASVANQPLKLATNCRGAIVTAVVDAGGLGYAANDTGVVDFGTVAATYRVNTVSGGGVVTTYTLTSAGTGYTTGSAQTTTPGGAQPGIGSGFTLNVTSVDASGSAGDGSLAGILYYQTADV